MIMGAWYLSVALSLSALSGIDQRAAPQAEATPFVLSLRVLQRFGTVDGTNPKNDIRAKAALAKALGKTGVLTEQGVKGFMDSDTFKKLAGADGKLDRDEMKRALEADAPTSRGRLYPGIVTYLEELTTSLDRVDESHREAAESLGKWIADNYRPGQPLGVIVVCTGNSRRSILGSTLGNLAAAFVGMPEVRFHSGGTAPTAFNPRTINALKEVGVKIDASGQEAKRGEPKTENPIYTVRWGEQKANEPVDLETTEFSKLYSDPANPKKGFAALMVCSEADAGCPFVPGASLRLSMPYLDPKLFDDSPYEAAKYRERRDDIGRTLLSALLQARRIVASHGTGEKASK